MTEQGVREIQLSGKQLVFLFMAAVVFAVVVFLLGVSVGRGVREATGVSASAPGDTTVTPAPQGPPLPPTKPAPGDLTYHDTLSKSGESGKSNVPPPATPPGAKPEVPKPEPAKPESEKSEPPKSEISKPETQKPPPPAAAGSWYVQVGSFKDKALADKLVRELVADGLPASLQVVSGALPNKVRVGPYADKRQADDVAKRLARHKPMVTK